MRIFMALIVSMILASNVKSSELPQECREIKGDTGYTIVTCQWKDGTESVYFFEPGEPIFTVYEEMEPGYLESVLEEEENGKRSND